MKKTEIALIVFVLITLTLNLMLVAGASALMVIMLLLLSSLYLFFGFALFNGIRLRNIFKKESYKGISALRMTSAIFAGIALSSTVIAILFGLQSWPGTGIMLTTGLCELAFCAILILIEYLVNKASVNKGTIIRMVIWGGLALTLLMLPKEALMTYKYRNYPAYVEAYKNAQTDPGNQQLQDKLNEERRKMEMKMDMEHGN